VHQSPAALAGEAADSSLAFDRDQKGSLYQSRLTLVHPGTVAHLALPAVRLPVADLLP
jgi:hypothetical protein